MKGPVETLQSSHANNYVNGRSGSDFSEYVWMAEEMEEFDKKVEEELFIENCIEELLEDEEEEETTWYAPWTSPPESTQLVDGFKYLDISQQPSLSIPVAPSNRLNPEAPEFVPRSCGSDDS